MARELIRFNMPQGQELQDLIEFSKVMAASPFYQKLGPGGVLGITMSAKELNLPIMPCLNGGMYNIQGRIVLSAQMMQAMIIRDGHTVDLKKLDETGCEIEFHRCDWDKNRFELYKFTIEDAKKAGYLSKDNWRNHLKDMLYNRCLAGGARKFMPDVLLGCYIDGEIIESEAVSENFRKFPKISEIHPQEEINQEKDEQFTDDQIQEFVDKHELDKDSNKSNYIEEICKACKKTRKEIIFAAMGNEENFEKSFSKWSEKQNFEKD